MRGRRAGVLIGTGDGSLAAELTAALALKGLEPTVAARAADLPALERNREFALAVLDADTLGDALADFAAAAGRMWPQIVYLGMATDPSRDTLRRFIQIGVFELLEKPLDITDVTDSVTAILGAVPARSDGIASADATKAAAGEAELHRLRERLQKVASQLRTLYHMGRDLGEHENWSDALDRFLMALVNFMDADGAALLLYSEQESRLRPRASFQVGEPELEVVCGTILDGRERHPRHQEIHSVEGYTDGRYDACLERTVPWRMTVIPLRHRQQALGFLVIEKDYPGGTGFKDDYDFLNTLQTIFAEEIASATYVSRLRNLGRFNNRVLNTIQGGVISTDLNGYVRFCNAWARNSCPALADGDAGSTHFNDLFRNRQFAEDLYERVLQSAKESLVLEVDCHGGSGEPFPAKLRTARMFDDHLGGMVVVAVFEDLTEQKRLENEVRRNDRLRVLGQLSAGVAHEIRNPLTGIATSAEVLSVKLGDDEEKTKYIRAILEEINRLDGIIRNLLTFARPPRPQIAPCAVTEVTGRVVSLLSEHAAKKGVRLAYNRTPDDVFCYGDAGQLTQVLLNVVLNAIQACDKGDQVKLAVSGEAVSSEAANVPVVGTAAPVAKTVRIDVEDSGPGVPAEVRQTLFEPFVTTKTRGTGLGLAISQQIIEEHRGRIECDFLNKGTRFSIQLPRLDPSALTEKRS